MMLGYKVVAKKQERGCGWFLCELEIPDDAKVIKEFSFRRTDKAIPRAFFPINTKTAITDKVARSWFDPTFDYELNKLTTSELSEAPYQSSVIKGIYFFESDEAARSWGLVNLGREGAV